MRTSRSSGMLAALLGFVLLAAAPPRALDAELTLLASVAIKPAFDELLPRFERASGDKVLVQYGGAAGRLLGTILGAPAAATFGCRVIAGP